MNSSANQLKKRIGTERNGTRRSEGREKERLDYGIFLEQRW
jgi:hypothetical protein